MANYITTLELPDSTPAPITVQLVGLAADGVTVLPITNIAFASTSTAVFTIAQETANPANVDITIVAAGTGTINGTATFSDGSTGSAVLTVIFDAIAKTASLVWSLVSPAPAAPAAAPVVTA
jgi:hypothetical protein